MEMNEVVLEVKNISKSFLLRESKADNLKEVITSAFSGKKSAKDNFHALSNLSFNLHKGESLGIIGKNGAGKSTLLKILSGITQPDEGEINFFGRAVSILDIGAGFHPELSGRENVYLSGALYNFSRKEIEAKFDEIVSFSGVEKFIDEPVKNYSSGMYLRLAFAIITCLDADIYLIDEVINVGDANFQMKCKTRIEELMDAGKTMLIASHNLNEISVLCSRIILLEDGVIVETGNSDVIQKYMTKALPEFFSFEGKDFFHLRDIKESTAAIRQIKVLNYGIEDYHLLADGISNKHSFKIFLELTLTENVSMDIRMKFYDSTGVLVFVCSSMQKDITRINATGSYRVEFTVPANLLNQRMYSADLTFINNDTKALLHKVEKFLTIKMANDNEKEEYAPEVILPGVVKPFILARINKL
jgi:ABC-type polysaccharide/polyol phosphate transport system ATPase subunit